MVLSVGEVALGDDGVEFGGLLSTEDLFPVPSNGLVDADVDERWGFLQPTNDFRKLGLTPRFDEYVGPQAIAMWEAETGRPVDGAILVDAYALSRLLGVVGTVEVGGTTYDEERLLRYLLQDQYTEFGASEVEQARRRAAVRGDLGRARRTGGGTARPAPIVETVPSLLRVGMSWSTATRRSSSGHGRSSAPTVARAATNSVCSSRTWAPPSSILRRGRCRGRGIAGTRGDIDRDGRHGVEPSRAGRSPAGVRGGTLGVDRRRGTGEYLGRLVVRLPGATSAARFTSAVPLEVFGPDGDGVLLGTRFAVRPGRSTTIRLVFEVSSELESMQIVPRPGPCPSAGSGAIGVSTTPRW
ncbi:MAG: DUF4012 domain-containing protein [Acidimicrobiales bacterium]